MTVHVLNGDALLERFPDALPGERLVFRECLIEGPMEGPDGFFAAREGYLAERYGTDGPDYAREVRPGLERLAALPPEAMVFLWFEDDLFCQANLWYVAHVLSDRRVAPRLVRPPDATPHGFAGLDASGLEGAFARSAPLEPREAWQALWPARRDGDHRALEIAAASLPAFVRAAVRADRDLRPGSDGLGRPHRTLLRLAAVHGDAFGPLFRAFCAEEALYGFGDLQVERMIADLRAAGRWPTGNP